MRQDVKKFLFLGIEEDKSLFFKRAQELGFVHFIDPKDKTQAQIPQEIENISAAIKTLRSLPVREQEENFSGLDTNFIVSTILKLREQQEKLQEKLRILGVEIARTEVFGNFSLQDIAFIENKGKCHIQFFCIRHNFFIKEDEPDNLIFITSAHDLDFYLSVQEGPPFTHDRMIEMKFTSSLQELKSEETAAHLALKQTEHTLIQYAKYSTFLHKALIHTLDHYHLHQAQTYVEETVEGRLFAVEGWIAANYTGKIDSLIHRLNIHADEIAIEETDAIPTCLQNEGLGRLGEDLVHIYDTPSATDADPSLWVLFCFTLFFAFIIGDAGYGAIYLLLALFLRYKFPNAKGAGKRFINLFTVLCVGCVIWGTLTTSFFGMQIALDNPLRKLSLVQWLAEKKVAYHVKHADATVQGWITKYPELKNVQDPKALIRYTTPKDGPVILNKITDNIMFELALFLGVVHLIVSMMRYVRRSWHHIGWVLFLIGSYLYFPYYLHTPAIPNYVLGVDLVKGGTIGFELLIAGIGIAWILAIFKYGWTGIFEITVLIQVFADSLSYLRLYALGLAGAIVGSTINDIASKVPLILGILLIIFSHAINIVLATMSGVIHGLRLNFLEWYHYSFEGGGKQFRPLKLLNKGE